MNYLFHLDNLSDDMDNQGTQATADVVLNSLYHPFTYTTSTRAAECVPPTVDSCWSSDSQTYSFWKRLITTAAPGPQQRFIETFNFFFEAVSQQAVDRASGDIPDLEAYIALRRDTSGCKPCWALIEYANNLDIPDEVMDHPVIRGLGEAANDLVTWSNVCPSFRFQRFKWSNLP